MKKLLLKLILNKRQKELIWDALLFSAHTYKRRGNVESQAQVQTVLNELEKTFGVVKQCYSKDDVTNLVNNSTEALKAIEAKYKKEVEDAFAIGFEQGQRASVFIEGVKEIKSQITAESAVERCKECDELEGCTLGRLLLKAAEEKVIPEGKEDEESTTTDGDESVASAQG